MGLFWDHLNRTQNQRSVNVRIRIGPYTHHRIKQRSDMNDDVKTKSQFPVKGTRELNFDVLLRLSNSFPRELACALDTHGCRDDKI